MRDSIGSAEGARFLAAAASGDLQAMATSLTSVVTGGNSVELENDGADASLFAADGIT